MFARGRGTNGEVGEAGVRRVQRELCATSTFRLGWRSDMLSMPLFACAERREVSTSLLQAEGPVRAAANTGGVLIILTVVLPEADGADVVSPALMERQ